MTNRPLPLRTSLAHRLDRAARANQPTAQQAYTAKRDEILRRMALITEALATTPDRIDWGHVGSLEEVCNKLGHAGHYAGVAELMID